MTHGAYNAAQRHARRVPMNSFVGLETPNTPDDYNREEAWNEDQAENMEEQDY